MTSEATAGERCPDCGRVTDAGGKCVLCEFQDRPPVAPPKVGDDFVLFALQDAGVPLMEETQLGFVAGYETARREIARLTAERDCLRAEVEKP